MDLTGWNPQVAQALRTLEHGSPERAGNASAALSWLVGEEGPEALTQASLQEFLWFVLPRKFLTPLADHIAVASALGDAMDLLELPRYAELCRSDRTRSILETWDSDRDAGFAAARRATTESRLDPPDIEGFAWGSTFGERELAAFSGVEAALELAIQAGVIPKAGRGVKQARERFVGEWMRRPDPAFDDRSPIEAVERERMEVWLGHRPLRRALLEPVATLLLEDPEVPDGLEGALAPLQWMLMKIRTGMRVTDRGYLDPAFVREAAEAFGWENYRDTPPVSEADVPALRELHALAKDLRAIRRTGRKVALTRNGADWATHVVPLWHAIAGWVGVGREFRHAVTEPALAMLLSDGRTSRKELVATILPVTIEAGWRSRSGGDSITATDVEAGWWQFVRPALLLGLIERAVYPDDWMELTEVGRATALLALRRRATGPRENPFG